ncbi:MAG: hypothetical protein JWP91_1256 [Fibrobacteres bacterium]|nr:hypothetical protein [Fibrobacterota bacterium]
MARRMSPGTSSKYGAIAGGFLLACAMAGFCAAPTKGKKVWNDLTSEAPETRKAAAAEILANRRGESAKILELAEKLIPVETRNGTVKDLILLLGSLRDAEAVPFLVRNLTFSVFYRETKRPQTIEDQLPAVKALADIGSPSLEPVLARAESEDEEMTHRAAAWIWRSVLGSERAGMVLEEEAKRAADPAVKQRLRAVSGFVKTLP